MKGFGIIKNEVWEGVLASSFSGIHKSKIICSVGFGTTPVKPCRRMSLLRFYGTHSNIGIDLMLLFFTLFVEGYDL
jgi:hypothetical protein